MYTGEILKKVRMLKGLNQNGIAKKLGITQQAYSKLEKTNLITGEKLTIILKALNCSERELEIVNNFPHEK